MSAPDTYVVYEGEEVVAIGTKEEVADALGVRQATVEFMASPSAHRKARTSPRRRVAERVKAGDAV